MIVVHHVKGKKEMREEEEGKAIHSQATSPVTANGHLEHEGTLRDILFSSPLLL